MLRVGGQTEFMTSRRGAVAGCVGDACGGGNISRQRVKIAAGGRKQRRTRRRKHRGGAYGVNSGLLPQQAASGFGRAYASISAVDTCSQQPSSAKVHQAGGNSLMVASASPTTCVGYGYTGKGDVESLSGSYAPITKYSKCSCGGGKNKKRRSSKRKGKKRQTKRRTRTRRHKRTRRTRRHRGGSQNPPSSPGYGVPGKALSPRALPKANPPPIRRNNYNGTGRCVDNYNHYTRTSQKN